MSSTNMHIGSKNVKDMRINSDSISLAFIRQGGSNDVIYKGYTPELNFSYDPLSNTTKASLPDKTLGGDILINNKALAYNIDTGAYFLSNVTSVANYGFRNAGNITTVRLGSHVQGIGDHAFENCANLTSVKQLGPLSLSDTFFIGNSAFKNCANLTNVSVPLGLSYFGAGVFSNCPNLKGYKVSLDISNIYYLGYDPVPSESSRCPTCIYNAQGYAFPDINISGADIPVVCGKAFYNCSTLSGTVSLSDLVAVGELAFSYSNVRSVKISGDTAVHYGAFRDCPSLQIFNAPDLTKISDDICMGDTSLLYINIPQANIIGDHAFYNCIRLGRGVVVPSIKNASIIDNHAFAECSNLSIGDGEVEVKWADISSFAFKNCANIATDIVFSNQSRYIGGWAFDHCTRLRNISWQGNMASTNLNIEERAFSNCTGLQNLYFPNGLKDIPSNVVSGANNSTAVVIRIPKSVTYISSGAFQFLSNNGAVGIAYTGNQDNWNALIVNSPNWDINMGCAECIVMYNKP